MICTTLSSFHNFKKKNGQEWDMIICYHMTESVIPRMRIYMMYMIIGVIVYGHVINIYIFFFYRQYERKEIVIRFWRKVANRTMTS